jgi:hypothetical protein
MKTSRFTPTAIVRRQASACGLLRAIVAVLTLVIVGNTIAYGQTPAGTNATKQKLQELGISKHIKVKELDGSTVKGTLTAVNDDSFQLIPKDGASPVVIAYSQVAKVARTGMPKAVKIVLWVIGSVVVAAIITEIVLAAKGF